MYIVSTYIYNHIKHVTSHCKPSGIFIGYWLDMEICIYMYEFWCGVILRDVREPERVHIFPYSTNNLFITYALLSQKA